MRHYVLNGELGHVVNDTEVTRYIQPWERNAPIYEEFLHRHHGKKDKLSIDLINT